MTLCMNARTLTQCSPGPGPNRRCTLATHFLLAKFQLRHIVRLSLEESGAPQMSLSSESRNEASDSGISPASNITPRLSLRAGLKAQGCHLHGPAFVLVPWGDWALLDTSTTSHAFSAAWVSRMGDQMTWSFVSLNKRRRERDRVCVFSLLLSHPLPHQPGSGFWPLNSSCGSGGGLSAPYSKESHPDLTAPASLFRHHWPFLLPKRTSSFGVCSQHKGSIPPTSGPPFWGPQAGLCSVKSDHRALTSPISLCLVCGQDVNHQWYIGDFGHFLWSLNACAQKITYYSSFETSQRHFGFNRLCASEIKLMIRTMNLVFSSVSFVSEWPEFTIFLPFQEGWHMMLSLPCYYVQYKYIQCINIYVHFYQLSNIQKWIPFYHLLNFRVLMTIFIYGLR